MTINVRAPNRIACSWSGGKDSCLALYRALQAGAKLDCLLTMFTEDAVRSRSHGLSREVLQAQADRIGTALLTAATTWSGYEMAFTGLLREARQSGVEAVVFGDIDLEEHRQWEERVCGHGELEAQLPLWQTPRLALLDEWWNCGFEARIVVVQEGAVDRKYLGQVLTREIAEEFTAAGIDACGEKGEFHTVVTNGPLFSEPLRLSLGRQVLRSGCWFQDVAVVS